MRLHPQYPIRTERLTLRPLSAADTDDLLAYRSIPEVCRYVPFEPMTAVEVADRLAASWARSTIDAAGQAITFGVELTGTGRLIGDIMLAFDAADHRSGEIGWMLNPADSGQGYATESAQAVLGLMFGELGLHRVVARIDERNDASLRLAERLRMRREARLVENEWFKGEWSTEIDFALLDREWLDRDQAQPGI